MSEEQAASPGVTLADAMARHQAGDLEGARPLYREHLGVTPEDANAWCLLGALEGQAGNHVVAGEAFVKATEADPEWAPAYAGLGTSLLMRGNPDDAVPALRKTLELKPDNIDARMQFALACRRIGRLDETVAALEEVLRRYPEHPDARYLLAVAFLETGQSSAAENCYRDVIRREPGRNRGFIGLGGALLAMNRPEEAEQVFAQAAGMTPTDPAALTALGNAIRAQGRLADADSAYSKALAAAPDDEKALVGLAELDRLQGRPEKGLERLRAVRDRQDPPASMYVPVARLLMDVGRYDEALLWLNRWLPSPELGPGTRASLLSLKGRVCDRLERLDEAWECWTEANRGARGKFDSAHFTNAIGVVCDAFSTDVFKRLAQQREWHGASPLLIVGTPRSGKSILEQMLACHPAIHGAGELRVLGTLTEMVRERAGAGAVYPNCIGKLGQGDVQELAEWYGSELTARSKGADWVIDTQPTNFLHLGLAGILCPSARVIFCRRNPVDVAWACYGRVFTDPALSFVASPEGIGHYLAGMETLASHWKSDAPLSILDLDYEKLVAEPESELRRVLEFLGLPWHDDCLQYEQPSCASLSVPPTLTGALNSGEIGRGQRYRDRLAPMEALLGRGADGE